MVGRPHNFEEITWCKVVQNHVFYSAQGQRPVFLPFGSHEHQNGEHMFNETIDWTHVNNWCNAYMTVPAFVLMVGVSGLEPPYSGAVMQVIIVSVL